MGTDRFVRKAALGTLLAGIGLIAQSPSAHAIEPAREFLEGLRGRGYHELALDYLDRMKTSAMIPVDLKEVIIFERGLTLVDAARSQRDLKLREKQLDEAQAAFDEFIAKRQGHPLVASARSQSGNVVIERARIRMTQAEKAAAPDQKKELHKKASDLFQEAGKIFDSNSKTIRAELQRLGTAELPPKEEEKRNQLRAEYVQAQLVGATVLYELAETVKGDKEAYDKTLTQAAEKYREVSEKYRRRLAGFFAKMFEARCYKDMGNFKEAIPLLKDLMDLPDDPQAFRSLKTKSMRLAMECWIDPDMKQHALAIDQGEKWIAAARPNEEKDPDLLGIKLLLAKAYKIKADKDSDKGAVTNARKYAKEVSKHKSDYQKEANELLAQLGVGGASKTADAPVVEAKTYIEARDKGRDALASMQTSATTIKLLERRIKTVKDADRQKEMQQNIDDGKVQLVKSRQRAAEYFRRALALADAAPVKELNDLRYFLAYLNYMAEDYYRAAVAAEFVAVNDPSNSYARSSAKIALASYLKLYNEADDELKEFEIGRLMKIAEHITRLWPDQKESDEALITLVNLLVKQGQLDEAEAQLQKIPVDSPRRGEAELRTGQALWSAYLQGMQKMREAEEGATDVPDPAELEDRKKRAQTTLADGVERMKAGELDATLLRAVLSLGQIYVDTDQPNKALELLVDPKIGAKTHVDNGHALTKVPGFAEETYKAALRAYIGALPGAQDSNAMIEKAVGVMDALKATVGETADGKKKLIAIYVSLARDLEQQMKISPPDVKQALSEGFEMFLGRAGATASEFNILNWVAETFYSLGKGFDEGQATLPPQAVKYYGEAIKMYEKILSQQDELGLDPGLAMQVRMRMAMTKRRMGNFEEALEMFYAILQQKQAMLNVQVEAAKTYQAWGAGKVDNYNKAIKGDRPDEKSRKNVIWGWGKLAQTTARYPKYRATFHEARYNLAECRYLYALRQQPAEKTRYLKLAKQDIGMTYRLYPKLGGPEHPEWRGMYDSLLKKVQQSLKEQPSGLDGMQTTSR